MTILKGLRVTAAKRRPRRLRVAAALVLPAVWMSTFSETVVGFVNSGGPLSIHGTWQARGHGIHPPGLNRHCSHHGVRGVEDTRRGSAAAEMLWSGGRRTRPDEVTVNIERPSLNSRRISGSIVIDAPIEETWLILTDYDRLADYVPNLTQSRTRDLERGTIRLFQEGAQNIIGFDFRASLEMEMKENFGDPENRMAQRSLSFSLLDSGMFKEFDGEWRIQFNSRKLGVGGESRYTTKLFYMVHIKPKGPVPVLALEWQIAAEVPNNLSALKLAAESVTPEYIEMRRAEREAQGQLLKGRAEVDPTADWEVDETLEMYIERR